MESKDYIKDLFSEGLNGFEAEVRPDLWNSISSKVNSTSVVSSSNLTALIVKSIISMAILGGVGLSIYYLTQSRQSLPEKIKEGKLNRDVLAEKESILNIEKNENSFNINDVSILKKENSANESAQVLTPEKNSDVVIILTVDKPAAIINEREAIEEIGEIVKGTNPIIPTPIKEVETQQNQSSLGADRVLPKLKTYDLPNVFTPNNDGINDFLEINGSELQEFSVVVLDVDNRIVFNSKDPSFRWDGRLLSGEEAPSGNYIYYITAKDVFGKQVTQSSSLTIRR